MSVRYSWLRRLSFSAAALLFGLALLPIHKASAEGLPVVAAENFYGDIVQQLGGPAVQVTSILSNPDQDPHLFEASPSTGRALATAKLVILNGADYDPWMEKLLKATPSADRLVVVVADLVHAKSGDNPHLWYRLDNVAQAAKAIAGALARLDAVHAADYQSRLANFLDSLRPLSTKIETMHKAYAGTPVTATEPVFGYMAADLGLAMRNDRFQLAVMNDTEPSAADIARFQDDLKQQRVHVLLFNRQTSDDLSQRLLGIAKQAKIPVVGVSETEPADHTYQEWMLQQLTDLDRALAATKQP
ncbi:MAG TPA: zinc ABC transporter substrate-binding protein [Terriglobia bacterium]|nr:zinc ABC transporter substrate-binding protein [Terriglobia bacterium]